MFLVANFLTPVFVLWMVFKIWKSSMLLAIGTLVFFPIAIIPLIQNWGDDDTDIRVPFFLALISSGVSIHGLRSLASEAEPQALLGLLRLLA